ncbi:hypothetical protein HanIR_Chr13g0617021 [Helianthus annuus]|nr:hypothetical protein HanIR_Chr13g0617021 [Helianthus annuus]
MSYVICLNGQESPQKKKKKKKKKKKNARRNFLTGPLEGSSTLQLADVLVFGYAGGKHVCVDLTGVSPLLSLRENRFVDGKVVLKAKSGKVAKHEKACAENTKCKRFSTTAFRHQGTRVLFSIEMDLLFKKGLWRSLLPIYLSFSCNFLYINP